VPRVKKTVVDPDIEGLPPTEPEPRARSIRERWRALSRRRKIGITAAGSALAIGACVLLSVALRFDTIVEDAINDQARERGLKLRYEAIVEKQLLPWQPGEPSVTLTDAKLQSIDAPGLTIRAAEIIVRLEGWFLAYEPDHVHVRDVNVTAPDLPSMMALDRSIRSEKTSPLPMTVEGATVNIARLIAGIPGAAIATAATIEIKDGRMNLQGVRLEVAAPRERASFGPVSAVVEQSGGMTWAQVDDYRLARFGMSGDGQMARFQAGPIGSRDVAEQLGIDLPPMNISGQAQVALTGAQAMTGTYSLLLDGYVPPHPVELNGILHDNKTSVSGKLRFLETALALDEIVVESGGLKLQGKGQVDWARGGLITMNLAGSVACGALARSALAARLPGLGKLVGGTHIQGHVAVSVNVAAKVTELKNLTLAPVVQLHCRLGR